MITKRVFPLLWIVLVALSCKENGATEAGPVFDLQQPTNLSLLRVGATAVRITWTDTSVNEEGFEVERRTNVGPFSGRVYTSRDMSTAIDSMNLTIDSTYSYRVRAMRYEQRGPYSTEFTINLNP